MTAPAGTPATVLFACVHNSGRSVAAKVLAEHYLAEHYLAEHYLAGHFGAGRVVVRSAGSSPGAGVNPIVAAVLAERGLSTEAETPTMLDAATVRAADVVITMGCGETCPVVPGKHREDWPVDDPAGRNLETVRGIVADIDARVQQLLSRVLTADPSGRTGP